MTCNNCGILHGNDEEIARYGIYTNIYGRHSDFIIHFLWKVVLFRKIWVNTQLKEGCGHKDVSANFSVRHLYWHLWQTFRLYHPFPIKTFIWCLIIWCLQSIHVQGKPYVHNVLFIENLLPRLFSYIIMFFMAVLYYWQ